MRHIIWRNRASAILGLLVMIIPLTGFPETLRTAFIILLGFLIAIFGFSRNSVGSFSYGKNENSAAREDDKNIKVLEEKKDITAHRKYHRKNSVKTNQEEIVSSDGSSLEVETKTDSPES